jgi:hypothetical protein
MHQSLLLGTLGGVSVLDMRKERFKEFILKFNSRYLDNISNYDSVDPTEIKVDGT